MADQPTIVFLAQAKPVANVLTDLYAVPQSHHALIQKIIFTNMQTNQAEKVSLQLAQKGVPPDDKQYFYLQDYSIAAHAFLLLEPQVTIDALDIIRVKTEGDVVVAVLGLLT